MSCICLTYAKHVPGICQAYARHMNCCGPANAWYMQSICLAYAKQMLGVCPACDWYALCYARHMHGICQACASQTPSTCQEKAQEKGAQHLNGCLNPKSLPVRMVGTHGIHRTPKGSPRNPKDPQEPRGHPKGTQGIHGTKRTPKSPKGSIGAPREPTKSKGPTRDHRLVRDITVRATSDDRASFWCQSRWFEWPHDVPEILKSRTYGSV